jgi:hypothetical protein
MTTTFKGPLTSSRFLFAFVLMSLFGTVSGQKASERPSILFMGGRVEVVEATKNSDGFATGPATICLVSESRGRQCYTPPEDVIPFGTAPRAEVVPLSMSEQALLFAVDSYAGGSGALTFLALLQPASGPALKNILPPKREFSNQGEYQLWREPSISPAPLLVVAEHILGEGEAHFSPHRFEISTYLFDLTLRRYALRDKYETGKKYPGLDDADKVSVLPYEKAEVLSRLRRRK